MGTKCTLELLRAQHGLVKRAVNTDARGKGSCGCKFTCFGVNPCTSSVEDFANLIWLLIIFFISFYQDHVVLFSLMFSVGAVTGNASA
jgi:hypothetical protein